MNSKPRTPITLILLGLLALAVVIWFGMPLLPGVRGTRWADPMIRLAVAGGLLGLWLTVLLIRALWRHRSHKRLIRYLLHHADLNPDSRKQKKSGWWKRRHQAVSDDGHVSYLGSDPSHGVGSSAAWGSIEQQQQEVREHFKGILWAARKIRNSAGKSRSLRDLPWLLVAGTRDSGKSLFLESAGLPFPMAEVQAQNPIRGSGSSRDCHWWLHQNAVLIEAPGRYFSQDSVAEDDLLDWQAFLQFLRGIPSKTPIQAVMLLVNTQRLLTPERWDEEVHLLQQRIQELRDHLGEQLEFHLVLTHMDAIAGFSDSFEQASPKFRHQYWGIPLIGKTARNSEFAPRIDAAWDDFFSRLDASLMERLQAEPTLNTRIAAFAFPNQLSRFKPLLVSLVGELFDSSSSLPKLKGVFLSSATQTPAIADWVSQQLAEQIGVDARLPELEPDLPRGYFVHGPIHQIAIPTSTALRPHGLLRRIMRKLVLTALVGLSLAMLASWSYNVVENRRLVTKLEQQINKARTAVNNLPRSARSPQDLLPYLNAMSTATRVFPPYAPLPLRTGLYQGSLLGGASKLAYDRALRRQFLPRLTESLETSLLTGKLNPEQRRQVTALYSTLDDPSRLKHDAFRSWFERQWKGLPKDDRKALKSHLDTLLHLRLPPQTIDYSLLSRRRRR